jgi:hypothetical protein
MSGSNAFRKWQWQHRNILHTMWNRSADYSTDTTPTWCETGEQTIVLWWLTYDLKPLCRLLCYYDLHTMWNRWADNCTVTTHRVWVETVQYSANRFHIVYESWQYNILFTGFSSCVNYDNCTIYLFSKSVFKGTFSNSVSYIVEVSCIVAV